MVNIHIIPLLLTNLAVNSVLSEVGPSGELLIYEASLCKPPLDQADALKEILLTTYSDETKSLSLKLSLPMDVDETCEAFLIADKWENNAWQKDAVLQSFPLFDIMNKIAPNVWKNFVQSMVPSVDYGGIWKAGDYDLKEFRESSKNILIPSLLYGRFKFRIVMSQDGQDFLCAQGEIESFPPELPKAPF